MNYLEWILAWDRWKQVNQPAATAIALWHELMAIWNKSGWQNDFTVPNGLLQIGAGLSRKEFDNARQWLIGKGRIYYTKSKRVNQAGRYRMLPFPDLIVQKGQREGQQKNPDCLKGATQGATGGATQGATGGDHNINKTKQNKNHILDELVFAYKKSSPTSCKRYGVGGITKARDVFEAAIELDKLPPDKILTAIQTNPELPPWDIVKKVDSKKQAILPDAAGDW